MTKHQGFTLLELMVVVALIIILSTMVYLLLFRSTITANEASAISSLKVIRQAEEQFHLRNSMYGDLAGLKRDGFIADTALANGAKSGYLFLVQAYSSVRSQWYAEATPEVYNSTGVRTFYVDESGFMRGQDTGESGFKSREIACLWPGLE